MRFETWLNGLICLLNDFRFDNKIWGSGAAVVAGDRVGWNGFGQLVPLLASRDVSLIGGRLYGSCAKWCSARR